MNPTKHIQHVLIDSNIIILIILKIIYFMFET
jgi:hypothetical protein